MMPEVSSGGITDAEFLDQCGVMQTAVLQIADGYRMAVELELIKGGCFLQQPGNRNGREFLFQLRHCLAERQMQEELDKADQVSASAAAVAVEQIFGGIDV